MANIIEQALHRKILQESKSASVPYTTPVQSNITNAAFAKGPIRKNQLTVIRMEAISDAQRHFEWSEPQAPQPDPSVVKWSERK